MCVCVVTCIRQALIIHLFGSLVCGWLHSSQRDAVVCPPPDLRPCNLTMGPIGSSTFKVSRRG